MSWDYTVKKNDNGLAILHGDITLSKRNHRWEPKGRGMRSAVVWKNTRNSTSKRFGKPRFTYVSEDKHILLENPRQYANHDLKSNLGLIFMEEYT